VTAEDRLAALELRVARLENDRLPRTLLGIAGNRKKLDGLCELDPDCLALEGHTPPCWDGSEEVPGSRLPEPYRTQFEQMQAATEGGGG
jgi:hypothetical protein